MVRVAGCGSGTYTQQMMTNHDLKSEIASLEATRGQFNVRSGREQARNRCPPAPICRRPAAGGPRRRSRRSASAKAAFLLWAAQLRQGAGEVHAVYEACGFGFTLQRQLSCFGHPLLCRRSAEARRARAAGEDRRARRPGALPPARSLSGRVTATPSPSSASRARRRNKPAPSIASANSSSAPAPSSKPTAAA